jgi:hypothetical protein
MNFLHWPSDCTCCSADAMGATPEEVERKLPSVARTARPVSTIDLTEVSIRSRHNSGVLQ